MASSNDIEYSILDAQNDGHMYVKNIAKHMAQKIADELTKTACYAIEEFYKQYNPEDMSLHDGRIYYYRHWNFRKSFKRYYRKRDDYYVGGVMLLRNELPNVYKGKNSSPTSVFDRVYLGYHGIASFQNRGADGGYLKPSSDNRVPILRPSPHKIIVDKYKYLSLPQTLKLLEKEAATEAKRDNTYKGIFR